MVMHIDFEFNLKSPINFAKFTRLSAGILNRVLLFFIVMMIVHLHKKHHPFCSGNTFLPLLIYVESMDCIFSISKYYTPFALDQS
jgi:hypothetical protein